MYRLAVALKKTVGEIEQTMTSAELSEWMAYVQLEPLPDNHYDMAMICSTVANVNGAKTSIEDFLPKTIKAPRLTAERSAGVLGRLFRGENV